MDRVDDPQYYFQRRESFTRSLQHFHETRGTPFRKIPKFCGKEVDLFLLYNLVTHRGGWLKVNRVNGWEELLKEFNIPPDCVNGGNALKQIYLRYLDRYEKVHFLGESGDRNDEDEDNDTRHRRWSSRAMHVVPLTYNYNQHNISDGQRRASGLSADTYKSSDYDRLLLSLVSPLPNEQDFAINVCTLLSNEGKHTLKLDKCPRILDYLLAHAGVYNHASLRVLFEEVYGKVRGHSLTTFWSDVLEREELIDLTNENKFVKKPPRKLKVLKPILLTSSIINSSCTTASTTTTTTTTTTTSSSSSNSSSNGCSNKISECSKNTNDVHIVDCDVVDVVDVVRPEPVVTRIDSNTNDSGVSSAVSDRQAGDDLTEQTDTCAEQQQQKQPPLDVRPETDVDTTTPVVLVSDDDDVVEVMSEEDRLKKEEAEVLLYETMLANETSKRKQLVVDEPASKKCKSVSCLTFDKDDKQLFCVGRSYGTRDYVGQRVLQVAHILRNLSFFEESMIIMSKSTTFLRFLFLCANSEWSCLHQLGLDMLGNVSPELQIDDPLVDIVSNVFFSTVSRGIGHSDRFVVISCLEVLNKISQKSTNEEIVSKHLDQLVYDQVCRLLSLHDIMILLYTLECLYSLSSLGEKACNCICKSHGAIEVLLALVTVEAQSYGPKACILMRVIETVSGVSSTNSTTSCNNMNSSSNTTATISTTPSHVQQQTTSTSTSTITLQQQQSPLHTLTTTPSSPSTGLQIPVQCAFNTSSVKVINTCNVIRPPTPKSIITIPAAAVSAAGGTMVHLQQTPVVQTITLPTVQQQHAHQQTAQENEQIALAWLRATFELCAGGKVEQQELYRKYLDACSKMGRKGVVPALHFPRCVRSVFGGTVGPKSQAIPAHEQKLGAPQTQSYYEGIKVRDVPLTLNIKFVPASELTSTCSQTSAGLASNSTPSLNKRRSRNVKTKTDPGLSGGSRQKGRRRNSKLSSACDNSNPTSPILKAQLISPNKTTSQQTDLHRIPQVVSHPHLSQALLGTTPTATSTNNNNTATIGIGTSDGVMDNSTLIKSLLASKVSELCMSQPLNNSMLDDNNTTQVTQRQQQQKLLQQQLQQNKIQGGITRLNGVIQDTSELKQQQLVPITGPGTTLGNLLRPKTPKLDVEDSDSMASTSRDCTTLGGGNISSAEDNSLTSFEGILMNGMPDSIDLDTAINTIVDEKIMIPSVKSMTSVATSTQPPPLAPISSSTITTQTPSGGKSLMLADLLDKKETPILNGVLGKEIRISEKGLELVENHIERAISKSLVKTSVQNGVCDDRTTESPAGGGVLVGVKRQSCNAAADVNVGATPTKISKPDVQDSQSSERKSVDNKTAEKNDVAPAADSQVVSTPLTNSDGEKEDTTVVGRKSDGVAGEDEEKEEEEDGEEGKVSSTAANLFAALAAEALEDETDLEVPTDTQQQPPVQQQQQTTQTIVMPAGQQMRPVFLGDSQPLIVTAPGGTRQIIMTPSQLGQQGQVLISAGGQITLQPSGIKTTPQVLNRIVQNSSGQQVLVSSQPQQYIVSTGAGGQSQVFMAQPQTALVQGQTQTVLVAQQQTPGTKTIIILQPQSAATQGGAGGPGAQQKMVVTPQGQLVAQVSARPPPSLVAARLDSDTSSTDSCTTQVILNSGIQNNPPQTSQQIQIVNTVATTTTTQIQVISSGVQNNPPLKMNNNAVAGDKKTVVVGAVKQTTAASTNTSGTNTTTSSAPAVTVIKPPLDPSLYLCEWRGCMKGFKTASEVYIHVCSVHCPSSPEVETQCLWERCDGMRRKRFSLMTHMYDRHCNPDILNALLNRRKQLSSQGRSEIPPIQTAAPHPGYAPNAAFHAIKRHAFEFTNPKELMDDNEGPVTKSIRLTASLILRNLVIYSAAGRRFLRGYESHLASIALSNVESSRTIAQVLADLCDGTIPL